MITPGTLPISSDAVMPELELAPEQVADGGREHERHRLHEVGADELAATRASGRAA